MSDNLTEKGKRDLKLINSALETGDPKAYNELMKLYRDPIYFMLYEKLGDQELAKDLTIEALGKAFKKLHLYTPNFAFSTWCLILFLFNKSDRYSETSIEAVPTKTG